MTDPKADTTIPHPTPPTGGADEAPDTSPAAPPAPAPDTDERSAGRPVEIDGQKGPEPTRYGDWEKNGRCTDF